MINYLNKTFPTPSENLSYDEVLLAQCETDEKLQFLRFWESPTYFVVLGRSNRSEKEVHVDRCTEDRIPILQRCTGGGTVLQGPGCLNYSLIVRIDRNASFQSITTTNRFIMEKHATVFESILHEQIAVEGITDLTYRGKKFSGNAQKRGRNALLFHGTFLYNMNLKLIEKYLLYPSKSPAYRNSLNHEEFLINIPLQSNSIIEMIKKTWNSK